MLFRQFRNAREKSELHGGMETADVLPIGLAAVRDLFRCTLDPSWEIYVRPYLNGIRPDLVLLNPGVGVGVFEVRDWTEDDLPDGLHTQGGDTSDPQTPWASSARREEGSNPMLLAMAARQDIFDIYCPRLPDEKGDQAVTAGVICPFLPSGAALSVLDGHRPNGRIAERSEGGLPARREEHSEEQQKWVDRMLPISGREAFEAGDVAAIFPESVRPESKLMNRVFAADLRGWLVEPDFAAEQRKALPLDARQRELATTRPSLGFRRLKGPAGSGKSLVLAARAARLMSEGKTVLIVTYNITLWHYLLGLVVRGVDGPGWMGRVRFTNFHYWCRWTCYEAGWGENYSALWHGLDNLPPRRRQDRLNAILDVEMPDLAMRAAREPGATRYDAILIDEAQDYLPKWWDTLRASLKEGGEVLLVADATPDVYGRARAWTDGVMTGAGFKGAWSRLGIGYRMPLAAETAARAFAERFLPGDLADLPDPQGQSEPGPCTLRWVQAGAEDDACRACVREVLRLKRVTGGAGLASADITFLTDEHDFGRRVVEELETYSGTRVVDTFRPQRPEPARSASLENGVPPGEREWLSPKEVERRKKMRFFLPDPRIKATTLHSFKGWETPLIVLHVSKGWNRESRALIYAGLTRLKRSAQGSWLTVVCSAEEDALIAFGRDCFAFERYAPPEPSSVGCQ